MASPASDSDSQPISASAGGEAATPATAGAVADLEDAAALAYALTDPPWGVLMLDLTDEIMTPDVQDAADPATSLMMTTANLTIPPPFVRTYQLSRELSWAQIIGFDLGDVPAAAWSWSSDHAVMVVNDPDEVVAFLESSPRWSGDGRTFTNQGGWDIDFDLDDVEQRAVNSVQAVHVENGLVTVFIYEPARTVVAAGGETATWISEAVAQLRADSAHLGWFLRASDHDDIKDVLHLRQSIDWLVFSERSVEVTDDGTNRSRIHVTFEEERDATSFVDRAPTESDGEFVVGEIAYTQEGSRVSVDFPQEERGVLFESLRRSPSPLFEEILE